MNDRWFGDLGSGVDGLVLGGVRGGGVCCEYLEDGERAGEEGAF